MLADAGLVVGDDVGGQRPAAGEQLVVGDHLVDQAPRQRGRGVEEVAGHRQLAPGRYAAHADAAWARSADCRAAEPRPAASPTSWSRARTGSMSRSQLDNANSGNPPLTATIRWTAPSRRPLDRSRRPPPAVEEPPAPVPPSSFGDVHFRTPDALVFDIQDVGDFVLLQSTDGTVVIQSRQEALDIRPGVSVNTATVINVDGDSLEFYLNPEPTLLVNGVDTPLPMVASTCRRVASSSVRSPRARSGPKRPSPTTSRSTGRTETPRPGSCSSGTRTSTSVWSGWAAI